MLFLKNGQQLQRFWNPALDSMNMGFGVNKRIILSSCFLWTLLRALKFKISILWDLGKNCTAWVQFYSVPQKWLHLNANYLSFLSTTVDPWIGVRGPCPPSCPKFTYNLKSALFPHPWFLWILTFNQPLVEQYCSIYHWKKQIWL